jgi:TonB family protein
MEVDERAAMADPGAIDDIIRRLRSPQAPGQAVAHSQPSEARSVAGPVLAVAAVLLCLLAAGLWLWPGAPQTIVTLTDTVGSGVTAVLAKIGAPNAATNQTVTPRPDAEAGGPATRGARATRPSLTPVPSREGIPAWAFTPGPRMRADAIPRGRPNGPDGNEAAGNPVDETVYSSADRDVTPPQRTAFERPGLPAVGPRTRVQGIEVLVNEQGTVERVRQRSTDTRMLDAITLSRVKSWQFIPAHRNGQPVRYRLLLQWMVSDH